MFSAWLNALNWRKPKAVKITIHKLYDEWT